MYDIDIHYCQYLLLSDKNNVVGYQRRQSVTIHWLSQSKPLPLLLNHTCKPSGDIQRVGF